MNAVWASSINSSVVPWSLTILIKAHGCTTDPVTCYKLIFLEHFEIKYYMKGGNIKIKFG